MLPFLFLKYVQITAFCKIILTEWLTNLLTSQLASQPAKQPTAWVAKCPTDWLTTQLTEDIIKSGHLIRFKTTSIQLLFRLQFL
jgi:hypothetical protein